MLSNLCPDRYACSNITHSFFNPFILQLQIHLSIVNKYFSDDLILYLLHMICLFYFNKTTDFKKDLTIQKQKLEPKHFSEHTLKVF